MKFSKALFVIAALIGATVAFAAEVKKDAAPAAHEAKCCLKAEKDGKSCEHACCVAAAKEGKNCEKCGGSGALAAKK
jgi:Spy/CpxP family protein refolding chaperone